jgi:medium-chain acyl-[acyl-carrier-protein] hydrolase
VWYNLSKEIMEETKMVYEVPFYIGYSKVGADLAITDRALLEILEDAAVMHATEVGDGMKVSPGRWFLTAWRVEILSRPRHEDRVRVETWCRAMRGASSSREFAVYGEDGTLLVRALSNWARVDKDTHALLRVNPELAAAYAPECERTNVGEPWIGRIATEGEWLAERSYTVERTVIDANRHMNNVYYADVAALSLPEDAAYGAFRIYYRRPALLGETLLCRRLAHEEGTLVLLLGEDETQVAQILYT